MMKSNWKLKVAKCRDCGYEFYVKVFDDSKRIEVECPKCLAKVSKMLGDDEC